MDLTEEEKRKKKNREWQKKYRSSEKGKKKIWEYSKSEKCKESLKKYKQSEKGKETNKKFSQTEKGKKNNKKNKWKTRGLNMENFEEIYKRYTMAIFCDICECVLEGNGNNKKCMDHCHITGEFRNIVCHYCNLSICE